MEPALASLRRARWISTISAMVFVISVALLPVGWRSPSGAGRMIARTLGSARGTTCVFPYAQQWYMRTPAGFEEVPPSHAADAAVSADGVLVSLDTHPAGTEGAWAPTRRYRTARISVWGQNATGAEAQALRSRFVDSLAAAGDPVVLANVPALRTRDVFTTEVAWAGWVHNVVSLVSLVICVAHLRWLPSRLYAARRSALGLCPACGYDLSGSPHQRPCPECGRAR